MGTDDDDDGDEMDATLRLDREPPPGTPPELVAMWKKVTQRKAGEPLPEAVMQHVPESMRATVTDALRAHERATVTDAPRGLERAPASGFEKVFATRGGGSGGAPADPTLIPAEEQGAPLSALAEEARAAEARRSARANLPPDLQAMLARMDASLDLAAAADSPVSAKKLR